MFEARDGRVRTLPETGAIYDARAAEMHGFIAVGMRPANRREVVLFIHGFRDGFSDGLATLADIWHYSRHVGVPDRPLENSCGNLWALDRDYPDPARGAALREARRNREGR